MEDNPSWRVERRRGFGTKWECLPIGICCLLACSAVALFNRSPEVESERTELLAKGKHKVYVNCETGSDKTGDGSIKHPFLSPMHARDFLRTMAPYTDDPVDVIVYGDCYPRNPQGAIDFSHSVLELRPGLDSGTRSAPISWVGGKHSRFLSGMPIVKTAWRAVNENVYSVDLLALGAEKSWFGGFLQPDNPGGNTMGRCTSHQAELFFGGNAMTLARYPNKSPEGKTQWLKISKVNDVQGEFQVADENVLNWAEEPDAWIHGYWSYDWADSYLQVYSGP